MIRTGATDSIRDNTAHKNQRSFYEIFACSQNSVLGIVYTHGLYIYRQSLYRMKSFIA